MEYLTGYFGNESGYRCGACGNCRKEKFPQVIFTERIRSATNYFMEEGFLPYIEKASTGDGALLSSCLSEASCESSVADPPGLVRSASRDQAALPGGISTGRTDRCRGHEEGWSLSYHGWSRIGKLVRASKYENGGPFALSLVMRAVEVIRTRYPAHTIDSVVSVPPTKSGLLVEMFAR